jgi:protoporphyrinogen oxidase
MAFNSSLNTRAAAAVASARGITTRRKLDLEGQRRRHVVIIGGGPAGLTAGYELAKLGIPPLVLEKHGIVGGLACTQNYKGFHFDMGGHRFFTKSVAVNEMWQEVLSKEFLRRPRLSRIYYKQRFFHYPLKPLNTLFGLGFFESILIFLSYIRWQLFPYRKEESLEQWVTNRFGKRLFLTFFKTYTEKVWGIPCSELRAEWAAQRIKDLTLKSALANMLWKPKKVIKTLIEEFDYPRLGPGMMWRAVGDRIHEGQGEVRMNTDVIMIRRTDRRIDDLLVLRDGQEEIVKGTHFISSMPITEFIKKLDPPPPAEVLEAAHKLKYRDFLTVCLVVKKADLFPDNWIYIHDPGVKVGRIQNFKNWSPDMVPDHSRSSLGLEYFCNEGDETWTMADADLVELGKQELEKTGLANASDVEDGCVFRMAKSYPVYDADYAGYLRLIREFVDGLENFQTVGRNGLHRYNNQDHAMLTGMLAVRNLVHGEKNDLWAVNADQEYHEEIRAEEPAAAS